MLTIAQRIAQARREQQAGRLDVAEALYRDVLAEAPQDASVLDMLGVLTHQRGLYQEAFGFFTQALIAGGPNAVAYTNLASACLALGRLNDADMHCRNALQLQPDLASAHYLLGMALRRADRLSDAEAAFREALRCDPDHLPARAGLAQTLLAAGRAADARTEFEAIFTRRPNDTQTIFLLSELAGAGHFQFSAEARQRIETLAARTDLPPEDQCRLAFALAVLCDKAGAIDDAFAHMRRGNAVRSAIDRRAGGPPFNPEAHRRTIDALIAFFTPAYFQRVRALGTDSEVPIFIVGMLRSGTTLTEQILASHPLVHGAGELRDIGLLSARLPRMLGTAETYPFCLNRLDAALAKKLAHDHLDKLRRCSATAQRVIDKFPLNFLFLGLIATLFPRARIIHCRRDPFDTCMSCYFQNFSGPFAFTYDLAHMGIYYREYERLMAHWRTVLPMLEVQYEELTAEPEATTRKLLAFCGLDWDERCLRFHETQRPVTTASLFQVRQPIYRSGVGRWRRYEKHAQPLIAALAQRAQRGAD